MRPGPHETALDTDGAGAAPSFRVIHGNTLAKRGLPPAIRGACRYRAATARVPAGAIVRHPACPRCGERLGYMETAGGALFLHVGDPAFRLRLVDSCSPLARSPSTTTRS